MTSFGDNRGDAECATRENPALAFEAEFDGARRPQAPAAAEPCDPSRYWAYFSSTD